MHPKCLLCFLKHLIIKSLYFHAGTYLTLRKSFKTRLMLRLQYAKFMLLKRFQHLSSIILSLT
jgi:hypothetical protein